MSVDLIAGVIQAADPPSAHRARKKLADLDVAPQGLFARIMSGTAVPKSAKPSATMGNDLVAGVIAAADPVSRNSAVAMLGAFKGEVQKAAPTAEQAKAARQMEESVLASVLNEMLPQSSSLYGDDAAGSLARQFQVDTLAAAAAQTEPLELAQSLYGSRSENKLIKLGQWPYFARDRITPFAS